MSGSQSAVVERIASSLVEAATRAGESRGLYGAEVGLIVRRICADFKPADFHVGSVREFVEKYVPGLRVVGKSDSDILYGLPDWPDLTPRNQSENRRVEAEKGQLWRVWLSPLSRLSIAVRKDGSNLHAVPKGEAAADEIEIEPARPEAHLEVARRFLDANAEKLGAAQSALAQLLENPDQSWWVSWARTLRGLSRDLNRQWLQYRQAALEAKLEEELRHRNVGEEAIARILDTVKMGRELRHRERAIYSLGELTASSAGLGTVAPPAASPGHGLTSRIDALNLIQDITSELPEHSLRKMSLLLGLMLDAMIDRQRR